MSDFSGTIARFTGFAADYDTFRPSPPALLAELLTTLIRMPRPGLVVDLGCGTGLSTRYWADKADRVVGVDPTESMRVRAEAVPLPNLGYRAGFSHDTGLAAGCADIVTCSQALHWMDPLPTFHEARRVLRPGGVFAAYDYDWPPVTGSWEADAAFATCQAQSRALEREHGVSSTVRTWDKESHLARMRESGVFRHTREVLVHHREPGTAERLVGALRSQGGVQSLLKAGLTESAIGVPILREAAERFLGSAPRLWHWSVRIRFGIT